MRIFAAGAIAGDCELRRGEVKPLLWIPLRLMFGVLRPRIILGQEFSGIVDAVGPGINDYAVGDPVFAVTGMKQSAYADYICMPAKNVTRKPEMLPHEEAAALGVGGLNALCFLRHGGAAGDMAAGKRILLNGAGGNIGTMAIQLARADGVTVDAVDSADKLDLMRDLGAESTFDYRVDHPFDTKDRYDAIIDIYGNLSFPGVQHALKPGGVMVLGNPPGVAMFRGKRVGRDGRSVLPALAGEAEEDLAYLVRRVTERALTPVIDRSFALDDVVAAHEYIETGAKKGCVVLTVSDG